MYSLGGNGKMKQNNSKTLCIKVLQTAFGKLVFEEDMKSEQNQISDIDLVISIQTFKAYSSSK